MPYDGDQRKTIFALASGAGKSGIAVIRISGPSTSSALIALVGDCPSPRRAALRKIIDPRDSTLLDSGLTLWLPGPASFTGEDSAELHIHGSRAVIASVLKVLGAMPGLRPAMAGEFARRALENGKLDLLEIEGLGDLIDAETEHQRRFAIAQGEGGLSRLAKEWRARLIDALVAIESELDFSDEADARMESRDYVRRICSDMIRSMAPLAAGSSAVERLRDGMIVLIAGPPNAGKSTLLNAMARRDVAIVSERAGTTRDLIEVRLDLGGYPVNLIDTAGIRATEDPVELEGIGRAIRKSVHADVILWLTPAANSMMPPPVEFGGCAIWSLRTKVDEANAPDSPVAPETSTPGVALEIPLSAVSGENLDLLMEKLGDLARQSMAFDGSLVAANERQLFSLRQALEALNGALDEQAPIEILAEELRRACFSLESLIGKVGVEDVLDQLFSRFCIGK